MQKTTLTIVMGVLCLIFRVEAQTSAPPIQPLKIGDKIPEAIWKLPLQVVNHPEGKQTITLNDYKGKMIILDFWATWCSNCVQALPKMEHLQEEFINKVQILPVTPQSNTTINNFLKKNHIGKTLKLPLINSDSILSKLFQHKLISHLVWIDPSGTVKATTWSEYATANNIKQVLDKKPLNWSMKKDVLFFDKQTPLLSFSENGASVPNNIYHSAVLGHLMDVNPTSGIVKDSLKRTVRTYIINSRIVSLCARAWNKALPELTAKQYIFPKNKSRYVRPEGVYAEDWNRANTYCYEAVMPDSYTKDQFAALLAEDLKRYLNVEGRLEKRMMECLIISKPDKNQKPKTGKSDNAQSATNLVWYLNTKVPFLPYAIDETGNKDLLISLMPNEYQNFKDLQSNLASQGLAATLQKREVDVFVLNEIR